MNTPSAFIKTKVSPPRVGDTPLARQRILSMLDERRDARLTLVVAPAGSGKSSLAALWRQRLVQRGIDVAWYNFGFDDDEAQFVGYLATSFQSSGLPIGAEALEIHNRYGGESTDAALAALVNDVDAHEGPVHLVLDDFHYCRSRSVIGFLERLLALAPSNFHLLICSRVRPALHLGPLRVKDQLTEIGFVDLRFTLDESVDFLRGRGVTQLSPVQMRSLHDLTDGWVAGLQLAAFSLRKSEDLDGSLRRLSDSLAVGQENRFDQYLRESVADHLDEEELDFLVRTSACRRFNRELCEVITGNSRAGELLAKFEADHLFVIPMESDDATPWYRFHRIFARFLNDQLARRGEPELRELHQLASHWFGGKGLFVEAVRHALQAGDEDFCIDLVDRAARSMVNGASFFQLLRWCDALPREQVAKRLNLLFCISWAQLSCGRLNDFEWTFQAIVTHPGVSKPGVQFEVELLQAYRLLQLDDTDGALRLVSPYLASLPKASGLSLLLLVSIAGWGLVHANRFEEARDLVHQRLHAATSDRPLRPSPIADSVVGVSHLMQGDLQQAKRSLRRCIDDTTRSATLTAEVGRHLAGYLAEVHYQLGEFEDVEPLIAICAETADLVGPSDSVLHANRAHAHLLQARGDIETAVRILDDLEASARGRSDRVVATCLVDKVHLELLRGQVSAAREDLRQLRQLSTRYEGRREGAYADIAYATIVAEAEVAASSGRSAEALRLLESVIAPCEAQGRLLRVAMLRVRAALCRRALGDTQGASRDVVVAAGLAARHGMNRVFPDEGDAALQLLRDVVLHGELSGFEREHAQSVLKAVPSRTGVTGSHGGGALSGREREILELLAKALSTKSIARSLGLSVQTVKWHLKNVYSKLGAVSREDAVIKARSINLVA